MKPSVVHNTFVLERKYAAAPERVFAAFSDPAQKRRWFVESGGHDVEHYQMDFRVGGEESARFKFKASAPAPVAGLQCLNDATYKDIVPNRRMVLNQTMAIGGRTISIALVTIELLTAESGTDLILTHQACFFEGSDGPQMREAGWRALLERLNTELSR